MPNIRTRFAPSPTGSLHVGGARTALFNYLFAKNQGGVFVLRIEDTDLERSDKKYESEIFDSLKWLGILYDEGPIADAQIQNSKFKIQNYVGDCGPYRQSERLDIYSRYLEKLLVDDKAFYCFHTEAELEAERERLLTEKKPPIHICEYRDIAASEAEKLLKEKPEHIIRFKTPAAKILKFNDLIRGEISFESELLGDFSLAKHASLNHSATKQPNDRATQTAKPFEFSPLYNFAVVIDDFEMKISHVIRGEDHISNTPKQMLIQESLGLARPEYAHLPLILGPDRAKLSKRHAASAITEYKEFGYLPEALVNFLALLGWNPGGDREKFSLEELTKIFDIKQVQKSGAVFNMEKLDWLNGEYIREKSLSELTGLTLPFFPPQAREKDREYLQKILAAEQPRLKKLSEIGEKTGYFFVSPEYDAELLKWKEMSEAELSASLDKSIELLSKIESANPSASELERLFMPEAEKTGDRGELLWPLRAALSGKKASPGPFEIMAILGRDESLKRLENAKKKLAPLENLY